MNWYWPVFGLTVVVWIAVPVCSWLEDRADQQDAETWAGMPGATR